MIRLLVALSPLVGLLFGGLDAHAQQGPAWQYTVENTLGKGQRAAFILSSGNTVHGVRLDLVGPGDKAYHFKLKTLKAKQKKRFTWPAPEGVSLWTGTLKGAAGGATTTAEVKLKIVKVEPLDVKLSKADVDLQGGRVIVRPSRPLGKVEIQAFDTEGDKVLDDLCTVSALSGHRSLIEFDVPEATTLRRIELKLHGAHGLYWAAIRAVHWYAEVAHEDVVFASGQWDIPDPEAAKMDAAIAAVQLETARFRKELGSDAASLELKVYVGGYTDRVGSSADNMKLSRKRAQSIARYFKDHGIKAPIFYQGFGERAQAVKTEDNVDAPRNRRAVYVLTNVEPRGDAFPGGGWRRL